MPVCLAGIALALPVETQACSMRGSPQEAREDIRSDESLRRIEGIFRVEGDIEWPEGYLASGVVRGQIESDTGRTYPVRFEYNEIYVQCGIQFTPPIDASGTFWITRRSRDGRYEMMLWEGEYTPEALARHEAKEAQ